MAIPRPILFALLGVALCAAAFLATRSADDTGGAVSSTPAATPATTHRQAVKPSTKASAPAHRATPAPHKATPAPARTATPAATKPQPAAKPAKLAASSPKAKKLHAIRALAHGNVVVFFFSRPGPADDTGTRLAVAKLAHKKGVTVISAGYDDLETYRPVLSGADVSQVPAIVVVRGARKGRLLQGFIDPLTLRQTVADARG